MSAFGLTKIWIWSHFSMQNGGRWGCGMDFSTMHVYRVTGCAAGSSHLDSVKQVAAWWVGQQEHRKCTCNLRGITQFFQFCIWMWVIWVFAVREVSSYQSFQWWFLCHLCLQSFYMEWPFLSSPEETVSGLLQIQPHNICFFKTIDPPGPPPPKLLCCCFPPL